MEIKGSILVVDDNRSFTDNIMKLLKERDYLVGCAANGKEAIELAENNEYDIAIIDIKLPDISGNEVVDKIAEISPSTDFIYITGDATINSAIEAVKQKRVVSYETKPLSLEHLLNFINQVAERKGAEEEIKRLAKFPSENPNPVLRVYKDGSILYHNKASTFLLDTWGCQTTRILPDNYIKIVSDVLHSGLSSVAETKCKRDRVISLTFAPVIEESYVNIYGMDITERKQAENALKESERKTLLLLNSTGEAIYGLDLEGNCTFCNPSCLRLLGYEDESQLLTRNMHALIHHTRKDGTPYPEEECYIYQAFKKGKGTHIDDEVLWRADGTSFAAEYRSFPVFHEGETVGAVVSFVDITERKRAEEEIKGLAKFPSENPNPVMKVFNDGDMLYHNKASTFLLDFWGCRTTKMLPDNYIKIVSDVLRTGLSRVVETECSRGRVISLTFAPVIEEGFVNIYGMDVTERKKAEENIKTINESLEKLVFERTKELEQKNIALSEILGQIEIEKKQIKDNVVANAETLLLPVIQKLKLTGESRKYIQLLQKNLQELTSSFGTKLTGKRAKLTSREIEICDMIKNGLTNKEIASLSNISRATIERHRANIRKKLGIIKKDVNLSSFLKTL